MSLEELNAQRNLTRIENTARSLRSDAKEVAEAMEAIRTITSTPWEMKDAGKLREALKELRKAQSVIRAMRAELDSTLELSR